jgi:hypothetical protein
LITPYQWNGQQKRSGGNGDEEISPDSCSDQQQPNKFKGRVTIAASLGAMTESHMIMENLL